MEENDDRKYSPQEKVELVLQHHHDEKEDYETKEQYHPMSGVGILHNHHHNHHQQHLHHHHNVDEVTSFPAAMNYATSEAAKSDIATICSGSVVEDIDILSVMSGDMGNTHVHPATPSSSQIGGSGGRKKERGVEFAAETLNMWKQHNINNNPKASSSSLQFYHQQHLPSLLRLSQYPPGSHNSGNNSLVLNDMGPPLSRSLLLERAGVAIGVGGVGEHDGVGLGPNSTGTISRAGSVRSYGSQATSDVVHVDTDDCGGSLIESEGKSSRVSSVEETSVHHLSSLASPVLGNRQHDYSEAVDADGGGGCSEECQDDDGDMDNNNNNNDGSSSIPSNTSNNLLCDRRLSGPHSSGRTSPGGTVYKGRGVRRYQGRYMHLPLKRFHQNGVAIALAHSHLHEDDDDTAGCCGDDGGGGSINDEDNVFGGGVGGSLLDHLNTNEGGGEGISPAVDVAQHSGGQRHHRERWTQRRSWSRSRSRERTGDRDGSGVGRKRSWAQSRSESPPLQSSSRSSNYNNNRSPSVSREFRGGNNNWNGGGGRWRHNHRGWNGCSNGRGGSSGNDGKGNNKWGDGSTPRKRSNNNFRRGEGGGGGYHQGGRQSQEMTPRDARHHRDRRR